ncbi:MAG: ATP phosphoribosyltransferase, partial [Solirubrobacterales bacterium]
MTTTIAIPRGALFEPVLGLLEASGVVEPGLVSDSRVLVFEGESVRILTVRPSDVPAYVEAGAAALGITG